MRGARRRLVDVAHAEPSAHVDRRDRKPGLVPEPRRERDERIDGAQVGLDVEDLRADVRVEARRPRRPGIPAASRSTPGASTSAVPNFDAS